MKVKKRKKVVTISSLKKKVWATFSKYIKLRDCLRTTGSPEYGECITCDFSGSIAKLDAGHFIPKHNANYFSERGVHAQCRKCNRYGSGMQLEYRRKIIELYGEGADLELEEEARQIKKFTVSELKELNEYFRAKIEELDGG